ncbi:MAG: DUF3592 domain-containing protein [Verrucomicrobia bacterium]|nr:DUF3592 domain-containing protein [Verrucomicrobiota bacterium]MCH8514353.1 DUF3592 domain-containing protein [Kiritimatiellia bacterium]
MSPKWLVVFGLVFLLPGLGISWFLGINPMLKTQAAQDWARAPAEVTSSRVRTHRGSDSTTYSIEIQYRYEWEGRTYDGDRYDFVGGSSSGRASKERVVREYPEGRTFEAYVNPNNPSESVIDPSFRWFYLGMLAFGGVFFLVGAGTCVGGVVQMRKASMATSVGGQSAETAYPSNTIPQADPVDGRGNVVLKPKVSPWAMVGGALFGALLWNGIVSVFVYQAWKSWQEGRTEWFLVLFLVPFVLIGAGIILAFFYAVLAAFNPRVLVLIGPGTPCAGQTFSMDWEFLGSTSRLQNFTVTLVGEETATYRQGTSTYTDKNIFHEEVLVSMDDPRAISSGTLQVTLPFEAIHSLKTPNNAITWQFKIHGKINFWPDLKSDYPFVLHPQPARFS